MRSLRTHSKLQGVGVGQGRDLERKEATTEGGGAEEGEQKEGGMEDFSSGWCWLGKGSRKEPAVPLEVIV